MLRCVEIELCVGKLPDGNTVVLEKRHLGLAVEESEDGIERYIVGLADRYLPESYMSAMCYEVNEYFNYRTVYESSDEIFVFFSGGETGTSIWCAREDLLQALAELFLPDEEVSW